MRSLVKTRAAEKMSGHGFRGAHGETTGMLEAPAPQAQEVGAQEVRAQAMKRLARYASIFAGEVGPDTGVIASFGELP